MNDQSEKIDICETDNTAKSPMHRFSHAGMATEFEVLIADCDFTYAQQAAWAAFDVLVQLEADLSRFVEDSEISQINNLNPGQRLILSPETFQAIELCKKLYHDTYRAFDITISSKSDCGGSPDSIKLDPDSNTVELTCPVKLDLGGFGKGFAVDEMAKVLREWDIKKALIHGGHSSVLALNPPPLKKGWPVSIRDPRNRKKRIMKYDLCNMALSGSGLGKGMHIIDPETKLAAQNTLAAWAWAETASTADALSTAFMILSAKEVKRYCCKHKNVKALLIPAGDDDEEILQIGDWQESGS